jgi:hypothetical protein
MPIFIVALLSLLSVTAMSGEQFISENCNNTSAVSFAKRIYESHYLFYNYYAEDEKPRLFTSDFHRAMTQNISCMDQYGICDVDFDPWIDAQDGYIDSEGVFEILQLIANTHASVSFSYLFRVGPAYPAKVQTVTLELISINHAECWQLDDFITSSGDSVKEMMFVSGKFLKPLPLSWTLVSADLYLSQIRVFRDNKKLSDYLFDCDLIVDDIENDDADRANSIDLIVTDDYPAGLLIGQCNVGAHSRKLTVYDLSLASMEKIQRPLWEATGSFSAGFEYKDGEIYLFYDKRCEMVGCGNNFLTVKEKLD